MVEKVKNIKTADTNDLVKKAYYNTKFNDTEKKITDHDHSNMYITTQKFNKLTVDNFADRLKQAISGSKSDVADFVKKTNLI